MYTWNKVNVVELMNCKKLKIDTLMIGIETLQIISYGSKYFKELIYIKSSY
ncbi:hypothetical protein KAU33_16890 [Candidatus Dependentiae bacterium]|nr:hypothetical protein [Candidatus Dependentiae bacterium]